MPLNFQKILEKIQKGPLYLLAFLLPLFFLPFTPNVLMYPKQLISLFLLSISFLAWVFLQYQREKVTVKKAKLIYLGIIILLGVSSFSTAFSLWWPGSLWGWPLEISQSLISLLIFVLSFFLLMNVLEKKEEILIFLIFLVAGTSLSALFAVLQFFGIFLLPWSFAKTPGFTLLGSPTLCGFFFLLILPLTFFLISITKGLLKKFFIFSSFLFVVAILLVNSSILWIFLALEALFLFFLFQKENHLKFYIGGSLFLLTLAVIFALIRIPILGLPLRPAEITLSFASELDIGKGVFQKGLKEVLLGTGPGTFVYNYSQFRSPLLNKTFVWGTRFPQGSSFLFDWFLGLGTLGGFALLFLEIGILKNSFKLKKQKRNLFIFLAPPLFLFFLFQFFYIANFSLLLLFFFLAGIVSNLALQDKLVFGGRRSWRRDIIAGGLVLTLLATLTLFYFEGRYFMGQVLYGRAISNSQKGDLEKAIPLMEKAIKIDSWQDLYWRDLAQFSLAFAEKTSRDETLERTQKERIVQDSVRKSLQAINRAITLNLHNVANWNVRGFIYRNLIGIRGAGELALESYKRAHQLEPASPYPLGEIGRVYILMAQNFEKEEKKKEKEQSLKYALNYLEKALKVKEDYALAHYLLAVVYDQQGQIKEAIKSLENTASFAPQDVGVKFQLGVLYFREREYKKAKAIFQQTLLLNPNYDDARYMLALTLLRIGERENAEKELKELAQKYPENETLRQILQDLEKETFLPPKIEPPSLEKPEEFK